MYNYSARSWYRRVCDVCIVKISSSGQSAIFHCKTSRNSTIFDKDEKYRSCAHSGGDIRISKWRRYLRVGMLKKLKKWQRKGTKTSQKCKYFILFSRKNSFTKDFWFHELVRCIGTKEVVIYLQIIIYKILEFK